MFRTGSRCGQSRKWKFHCSRQSIGWGSSLRSPTEAVLNLRNLHQMIISWILKSRTETVWFSSFLSAGRCDWKVRWMDLTCMRNGFNTLWQPSQRLVTSARLQWYLKIKNFSTHSHKQAEYSVTWWFPRHKRRYTLIVFIFLRTKIHAGDETVLTIKLRKPVVEKWRISYMYATYPDLQRAWAISAMFKTCKNAQSLVQNS